jgi:hypothetical protein
MTAGLNANLLICKDEKAARLLEVVEDFKNYIETAKGVETIFLISALNVLSESKFISRLQGINDYMWNWR